MRRCFLQEILVYIFNIQGFSESIKQSATVKQIEPQFKSEVFRDASFY